MILIISSSHSTKNTIFKPQVKRCLCFLYSIKYSLANKNSHHSYNENYFVLSEINQICPPIYQFLLLIFLLSHSFLLLISYL